MWRLDHQILWLIAGFAWRSTAYSRAAAGVKKNGDLPPWPETPWSESDSDNQRYGYVAEADRSAALAYLAGLAPTPPGSSDEE